MRGDQPFPTIQYPVFPDAALLRRSGIHRAARFNGECGALVFNGYRLAPLKRLGRDDDFGVLGQSFARQGTARPIEGDAQ